MWGKFAAIIGPLLMAGVTTLSLRYIEATSETGIVTDDDHTLSARIGFLSLIILFILGAYVFSKVDIEEGERIAKKHL